MNFDAAAIKNLLHNRRIGSAVLYKEQVDSTNDWAKEVFTQRPEEGLVVLAGSQTSGRGRHGRAWHSEPHTGVYLSIVLRPGIGRESYSLLTLMAGVACATAVNQFAATQAKLKWPNDILVNGKKLGGILSEYCLSVNNDEAAVIGIGLNVNQSEFPGELQSTATSLKIATGTQQDRLAVTVALLNHLDREYDAFLSHGPGPMMARWDRLSMLTGRQVILLRGNKRVAGTTLGLSETGNLLLQTDDGRKLSFDSGEVSLKLAE
jgi:BirA family biotin operon repressor/biotin-[acetyl-CoA-carboxylase] ligase